MNNTALITGASGGIGLELAKIHASKSGNLVLIARSEDKLNDLKKELENSYNISVYTITKDLSKPVAVNEIYDEIHKQGIVIDYLINNAGFGDYAMFADADTEKISQMINLNVTALTHLMKLYLPDMIERRSGKIMNVASIAAFEPGPLMAVYYATKAYVLSLSEAVNNEIRNKGITVTALCPGPTESGFWHINSLDQNRLVTGKKLPSAKEVAEYGYKAMINGKAVAVHGFKNKMLVTLVRFSPRSLVVKLVRKMQEK